MSSYKYKYTCPTDNGYTQFKLTKKQHNELFPNRKSDWRLKYEYYYDEYRVTIHEFYSRKGILLIILLLPLSVLYHGIGSIGETIDDLKGLYNQKEKGSFISRHISREANSYKSIINTIKK